MHKKGDVIEVLFFELDGIVANECWVPAVVMECDENRILACRLGKDHFPGGTENLIVLSYDMVQKSWR